LSLQISRPLSSVYVYGQTNAGRYLFVVAVGEDEEAFIVTARVRSILERAASGGPPAEMSDITERLERIERAVTGCGAPGQKRA